MLHQREDLHTLGSQRLLTQPEDPKKSFRPLGSLTSWGREQAKLQKYKAVWCFPRHKSGSLSTEHTLWGFHSYLAFLLFSLLPSFLLMLIHSPIRVHFMPSVPKACSSEPEIKQGRNKLIHCPHGANHTKKNIISTCGKFSEGEVQVGFPDKNAR